MEFIKDNSIVYAHEKSRSSCPFIDKIFTGDHDEAKFQKLSKQRPEIDQDEFISLTLAPNNHLLGLDPSQKKEILSWPNFCLKDFDLKKVKSFRGDVLQSLIEKTIEELNPEVSSALILPFFRSQLTSGIEKRLELHTKAKKLSETVTEDMEIKSAELQETINLKSDLLKSVKAEEKIQNQLVNEIETIKALISYAKRESIRLDAEILKSNTNNLNISQLKANLSKSQALEHQLKQNYSTTEKNFNNIFNSTQAQVTRKIKENEELSKKIKSLSQIKHRYLAEHTSLQSTLASTHLKTDSKSLITLPSPKQDSGHKILEEFLKISSAELRDYKKHQKNLILSKNSELTVSSKLETNLENLEIQIEEISNRISLNSYNLIEFNQENIRKSNKTKLNSQFYIEKVRDSNKLEKDFDGINTRFQEFMDQAELINDMISYIETHNKAI